MILIGVLCFLAMTTEGAIGDWGGIYLRENLGASAAASATAFTGVSLGMAIARLGGDWLNERLGAGVLLRGGMALVAGAMGTLLLIAQPVPAVIGFVLVGLGIANAVPILFSAAGRHEPTGPSLSAVFTVGYTGFIVGPPLIGVLRGRDRAAGHARADLPRGARRGRRSAAARPLFQCLIDQPPDLLRRVLDAARELAPVGIGDRAVAGEHLGEAADDRQRRAQVVAQLVAGFGVEVAHSGVFRP